jgi:glutamate dehydrogenase/leucine dehydrogenase
MLRPDGEETVGIDVLERIGRSGGEGVYLAADQESGLKAIIAIHSTALGPALGGTRFRHYDGFGEALHDVLRLSRAMTYKAAAADLPLGGGKAVIIGDPDQIKCDALLEAYGRAVDALGGKYVTAEDVGTTVGDMTTVRRTTRHVTGLPAAQGGSGDPSPATARGVLAGMKTVAEILWGRADLGGRRIAIQALGKVGSALAGLLSGEGCELLVSDIVAGVAEKQAARVGADVIPSGDLLKQPCDIFAPCALGTVLDAETIPTLDCAAVVGSANNQLADDSDAGRLAAAGILYAPDFVVNAGGIINIAEELHPDGYSEARALQGVDRIGESTSRVLSMARELGITTLAAARAIAEERLAAAG